jgi:hypothetical protein
MCRRPGLPALASALVACAAIAAASAGMARDRTQPSAATAAARDTDRDGLSDSVEVRRYHTNPRKRDTDGDRLTDADEIRRYHTSPLRRDTDKDGYSDGTEVLKGTDPRSRRTRPGFPRADTTGVPAGTTLTAYTGPSTISTPDSVITGKRMGCVRVAAAGVVIRRSKISCSSRSPAVESRDGDYLGTPLLLEDSEIDCGDTSGTAIGDANVTARRLNIHRCENGFDINQNITVEDSYIHDLYNSEEAHADGIQLSFGHWNGSGFVCCALNVTIRHNTIFGMGDDASFATSAIISNGGGDKNILIENNLLAGGAYTLYCEQNAKGSDYRVLDNRFSTRFSAKVGYYGPATECSDETQSGNAYHETGKPLRLE